MTTLRLPLPTARPRRRAWAAHRTIRRLAGDPHALLGVGLVATTLAIAVFGPRDDVWRLVGVSLEFLAAQAIAAVAAPHIRPTSSQRTLIGIARFALAILYVAVATGLLRSGDFRPAAALFIPIVALAASDGARQAILVGAAAIGLYLVPVLTATPDNLALDAQRAIALGGTALLLSIGTRRSISALRVTVRRLHASLARDRRRSRQVAAVEGVGRLLAATGPAPDTLERIVSLLREDLGYDFVSIYLGSSTSVRLAAQRGYERVIDEFDSSTGVIGRVMRTRQVAFVPDVSADPDYLSASGIVRSEVSAPLLADGELLGVMNVEGRAASQLDSSDVETMSMVAERMAPALALARERERLAARAERFRRLTAFATAVNATLDPARVHQAIVDELLDVCGADSVALTVLDRATGRYAVAAVAGTDPSFVGVPIDVGEGLAGRAIRDRVPVVDGHFDARTNSTLAASGEPFDPLAGVAAPLIRDDAVVGAITIFRTDLGRPFSTDDLESLPIVAGLTALAITNTFLHAEVTELSVRDPLTGLFNRRYLDAALTRLEATRARRPVERRDQMAVAIFDLDHFGAFNKQHGHQVGDEILRPFAEVLLGRFRGTDLVARYGGEEFVALLDGATLDQARDVCEEIRLRFAERSVAGPDGTRISATVSAGCAAMGADEDRFADIIARADVGLVLAKRSGRDRVVTA
jgi:diguanylate cyclase (GGDEF)-like protein